MSRRTDFGKPMPRGKEAVEFEDGQFQEELKREKRGHKGVLDQKFQPDDNKDIRKKVVSGDPFTPSANKVLEADMRYSADGMTAVKQDDELHCDTTEPGEVTVKGMKKGGWTSSAKENLVRQKDDLRDVDNANIFKN